MLSVSYLSLPCQKLQSLVYYPLCRSSVLAAKSYVRRCVPWRRYQGSNCGSKFEERRSNNGGRALLALSSSRGLSRLNRRLASQSIDIHIDHLQSLLLMLVPVYQSHCFAFRETHYLRPLLLTSRYHHSQTGSKPLTRHWKTNTNPPTALLPITPHCHYGTLG